MSTSGDQFAHIVSRIGDYATNEFANSSDDLFTALDEEDPVVPATMIPPIRESIAGMRALLAEAETVLDALEK